MKKFLIVLCSVLCSLSLCFAIAACGESGTSDPTPSAPSGPSAPSDPDTPDNPDNPSNPSNPDTPDNPDNPSNPSNPDTPDNPDNPSKPDTPDNPDNPSNPSNPDTPDNPDNPDNPSKPDNPDDPDEPVGQKDITGVTFVSASFPYDGHEHEIRVTGTLPKGITVAYTNNKLTDAGEKTATAILSGDGYNTLTLHATITVTKAEIDASGVHFESVTFPYDEEVHTLTATGLDTLPAGVNVAYQNNTQKGVGTSNATLVLSGDNYITKELHATITVQKPTAKQLTDIVSRFFEARLNIWDFVPNSLKPENMLDDGAPTDFNTDFVDVSSIGKKAIGKQLNVVYDIFTHFESISQYVEIAFAVQDQIVNLYQAFINDDPENYASFTHNGDTFDFKIELTDTTNTLLIGVEKGAVKAAIELSYERGSAETCVRIQLSDSNVLRYESSPTHLKAALDIVNLAMWQVEFDVNGSVVDGKLYEFYGTESTNIKTVAEYHKTASYTYILGDKRESDDLKIEGSLEAYDNATGRLVGSKVKETVSKKDYDTQWFNLWEVTGITSIKKEDKQNVMNADTIYINGKSDSLHSKTVSFLDASRRFDIEFKEVWYFQTGEDGKPEKVKTEIPMLFIQQENIGTFEADFLAENDVTVTLNPKGHVAVAAAYAEYVEQYAQDKVLVERSEIVAFIGTRNSFFTD